MDMDPQVLEAKFGAGAEDHLRLTESAGGRVPGCDQFLRRLAGSLGRERGEGFEGGVWGVELDDRVDPGRKARGRAPAGS